GVSPALGAPRPPRPRPPARPRRGAPPPGAAPPRPTPPLSRDTQKSDRRKNEFLAMLAHELRNPLAPIRSAVQIMRLVGPDVPDLQWARTVIERQVQHMVRLVDDLLDVSRITRGKIKLQLDPVDIALV